MINNISAFTGKKCKTYIELPDLSGSRFVAVDLVSTDSPLLSVAGVLDVDILRLADPFQPFQTDLTLILPTPIAAVRDQSDGVLLHKVLSEHVHTGGGDGHGHVERTNSDFPVEDGVEAQACHHQNHDVGLAVVSQLLLQIVAGLVLLLLSVPGVELLALGGHHGGGAVPVGVGDGSDVVPILHSIEEMREESFLQLRNAEGLGKGRQSHRYEVERIDDADPGVFHFHELQSLADHRRSRAVVDQILDDEDAVVALKKFFKSLDEWFTIAR